MRSVAELDPMEEKILDFMRGRCTALDGVRTLEVAKGVGQKTKKNVNPHLYNLKRKGLLIKCAESPPTWMLGQSEGNSSISAFEPTVTPEQKSMDSRALESSEASDSVHKEQESTKEDQDLDDTWLSLGFWNDVNSQFSRTSIKDVGQHSTPAIRSVYSRSQKVLPRVPQPPPLLPDGKNAISALHEYATTRNLIVDYHSEMSGSNDRPSYWVTATVGGQSFQGSTAWTEHTAKLKAAETALSYLYSSHQTNPTSLVDPERADMTFISSSIPPSAIKFTTEEKAVEEAKKVVQEDHPPLPKTKLHNETSQQFYRTDDQKLDRRLKESPKESPTKMACKFLSASNEKKG